MKMRQVTVVVISLILLYGCKKHRKVDTKVTSYSYSETRDNLISSTTAISFDSDIELSDSEMTLNKNLIVSRAAFIENSRQKKQSIFNHSFSEIQPIIDSTFLYKTKNSFFLLNKSLHHRCVKAQSSSL